MKTCTKQRRNRIHWTLNTQLEGLEITDDLALAAISSRVGLNLHKCKTKFLKVNSASMEPIKLEGNEIEEVDTFTYLGSIIDEYGVTDADECKSWRSNYTAQEHLELQRVVITYKDTPG